MTADDMQIPAAPTPYNHQRAAAVWGANAIEPPTCTWWHWRDNGLPAMCWKSEAHHTREAEWSAMSHQDPVGGVQGPWFDSDTRDLGSL